MINTKIFAHLQETSDQASRMKATSKEDLLSVLESLQSCPTLNEYICQAKGNDWPGAIPSSKEPITSAIQIERRRMPLVAVDGSQIYPDLRSPVRWSYVQAVAYHLGERPQLFSDFHSMNGMNLSLEELKGIVGGWRSALEMKAAAASARPGLLVLMDGSLLPWLSESRLDREASEYRQKLISTRPHLIAGVISSPRSRLISRLSALVLKTNLMIMDLEFMQALLSPGQRSATFLHGSPHNTRFIHEKAGIHFFFMRINIQEIVRVEIPQWIAHNPDLVNQVAGVILEDSRMTGYSYTLSQAHHHAAISKDISRQLQEQAIARYYLQTGRPPYTSAKNRAKSA